ncbi:hypothetical protein CKAH01_14297 [Colletotrichum kahawae]|uniref:Uncharacterized protein n=1 Tax=Colletotrichum kahawae TaxID=34407 RepID=A0AAD9YKZ4_COLKA|nr:hypothetical protein CKAH01_14297 [Colletotrichum kahawae]
MRDSSRVAKSPTAGSFGLFQTAMEKKKKSEFPVDPLAQVAGACSVEI